MTSWYAHLDELKTDIDALIDASKFPKCSVEVSPAPPDPKDKKRMAAKATQVYLSLAGMNDSNVSNAPTGEFLAVAHVYTRDGHTAKHGAELERNRLAAMICEQLHVLLRDPTQYQVDAPSGRNMQMGRGQNVKARNLSFRGDSTKNGKSPSPDVMGLAHWVVTWQPVFESEAMNPDVLDDLTSIYFEVDGEKLGGDNPDPDDNEETRVTFP